MISQNSKNGLEVKAYAGDSMTLLAFDIDEKLNRSNFVGFTIQYKTPRGKKYFLYNSLNFDGKDALTHSDEAPFQKFRWIHVPGVTHQDLNKYEQGSYTYYVTPRYFNKGEKMLEPIDKNLTVDVSIDVQRFVDGPIELAFTRSYLTSQAYQYRFGTNNDIIPKGDWLFDTSKKFAVRNKITYSYEDLYEYLGFTARQRILELLDEAVKNKKITVEMFAYDLNEPQIANRCLALAKAGRIRVILDDSVITEKDKYGKKKITGHGTAVSSESKFEGLFKKAKTGNADITRGHFSRLQHNKIFIFLENTKPKRILTGSTNFSITGLCVNANHVAVFNDPKIAELYHNIFEASYGVSKMKEFSKTAYADSSPFTFSNTNQQSIEITYSPHNQKGAEIILQRVADSVNNAKSSVLFSVMQIDRSGGPVMPALKNIQNKTTIFSYGISDQVSAVSLYKPGSKKGILVNAKSISKVLPPPFKLEADYNAHKIHHKFVVTDFNTPDAAVYFGSSNLALGGEESNGDNLICVKDQDIATVYAIEALRLVDHFHFRAIKYDKKGKPKTVVLKKDNSWAKPYFDPNDIKYVDRKLFA